MRDSSNLERYRVDLESLIARGKLLLSAMEYECFPREFARKVKEAKTKKELDSLVDGLPRFADEYQGWYSEAKAVVKQLLPDRLGDLVRHYEKPKPRKAVSVESYRVEDYLLEVVITRAGPPQRGLL